MRTEGGDCVAIFVAGARSTETQSMCSVRVVLGGIY